MKVLETTLGNLIDNLDWHYLSLLAEALSFSIIVLIIV
jgi:hypothetical protein